MDKQKTLTILETLANGVDPVTRKVFPSDSTYQHEDIIRALLSAIVVLKEGNPDSMPVNQGTPWTDQENRLLEEEFLDELPIKELARIHQRSTDDIHSRLKKIGLIL